MAEQFYPITVPSTSTLWNYSPQLDGDIGSGWTTQYSGGTETFEQGFVYGYGVATRVTKASGATFSLDFYGSGITLRGSSNGVAYEVTLDGQKSSGSENSGVLASFSGLETKTHSISLQAFPSGSAQFSFERADVNVGTGLTGATITSTTYDAGSKALKVNDMVSNYEQLLQNKNRPNYLQGNQKGDYVQLTFKGAAVSIFGMCNGENGNFQVILDGNPRTFSATAAHWELDILMFYQAGLDPSVDHTIQYMNIDQEREFDFISFVTLSISGGTKVTSSGGSGGGTEAGNSNGGGEATTAPGVTGPSATGIASTQLSSGVSSLPSGSPNATSLPFFGPSYGSNDASQTVNGVQPSGSITDGNNSGSGSGSGSGSSNGTSGGGSQTTAIILGSVLGAVLLVALLVLVFFLGRRRERRRLKHLRASEAHPLPSSNPPPSASEPDHSTADLVAADRWRAKEALGGPDSEDPPSGSPTHTSQFHSTILSRTPVPTSPSISSRGHTSFNPFTPSFSESLPPRFTMSSRALSPPPQYAPREE